MGVGWTVHTSVRSISEYNFVNMSDEIRHHNVESYLLFRQCVDAFIMLFCIRCDSHTWHASPSADIHLA